MVAAIRIIELNVVLAVVGGPPQVHVAVRFVISIRLSIA